jgi:multidrug resistance protein, MATE family
VDRAAQRDIFKLGLPAAGHTGLEVGAFALATLFVSLLGAVPLAAHHVCLMMSAFTFMFPLGFSSAAAVRVGFFLGAGQPARARLAGWLCIGLSVAVMSGFALCYLTVPRTLLGWFTKDPTVIETGVKILLLVAFFQIGDGIQVSSTGALRGLANTRAAMIANLLGHYPIGLALGLTLCFGFKFGVVGMWIGLAAGLISVAAMQLFTWVRTTREVNRLRPIARTAEESVQLGRKKAW